VAEGGAGGGPRRISGREQRKQPAALQRNRWAPALLLGAGISQYVGASLAVGLFAAAPALAVGWGRIAGAAVLLLLWRRTLPRDSNGDFSWRVLGAAAIFGLALGAMNLTFYLAIDRIPLGTAVSLEYLGPVVLAVATGRGWKTRLGAALAIGGVFLISWAGVDLGDADVAAGVTAALAAGAFWALYIWLGRRVAVGGRGLDSLAWAMTVAALVYAPLGVGDIAPIATNLRLLLLMLTVAALSSVLPYGVDQIVMRSLRASTFALLSSLLPATSLLVGLVVLRQVPNAAEVFGLIAISAAVALATSPQVPESS